MEWQESFFSCHLEEWVVIINDFFGTAVVNNPVVDVVEVYEEL